MWTPLSIDAGEIRSQADPVLAEHAILPAQQAALTAARATAALGVVIAVIQWAYAVALVALTLQPGFWGLASLTIPLAAVSAASGWTIARGARRARRGARGHTAGTASGLGWMTLGASAAAIPGSLALVVIVFPQRSDHVDLNGVFALAFGVLAAPGLLLAGASGAVLLMARPALRSLEGP